MVESEAISDLLRQAEREQEYDTESDIVHLRLGLDTYAISDLHIGRGKGSGGCYSGTENFFYDEALARFLTSITPSEGEARRVLVINGDFIDFLRIVELPESAADYTDWRTLLAKIGIYKSEEELRGNISEKERTYGLRTNDYKSAYRLMLAADGHPALFTALADWLALGNRLVISKGNHDLEWIWPAARKTLRLLLAEQLGDAERALSEVINPGLTFIDKAAVIDNELYIEHGHRYDKFSQVAPIGEDMLSNGEELNIPFGSFFNRYLVNKIELVYPYFDNIRPRTKLLPLLIRERLPLAIKVLFAYIPFLVRVIPKRYFFAMYAQALTFLILFVAPLAFVGYELYRAILPYLGSTAGALQSSSSIVSRMISVAESVGSLVLSYLVARVIGYFQLDEPSTLAPFAKRVMKQNPELKYFTFGHTHNPEQFVNPRGQWFYNTGTWIPVIDVSSAEVRQDRTFTLLRFHKDAFGQFGAAVLERWNDDAGRLEDLVLTTEKQTWRRKRRARKQAEGVSLSPES